MPTRAVTVSPFATRVVSRYALAEAMAVLVGIANSVLFPLLPMLVLVDWFVGHTAALTVVAIWLCSGALVLLPAISADVVCWLVGARSPSRTEFERLETAFDRVARRAAIDPTRFNLRVVDPPDWYTGVWINGLAAGNTLIAISRDALELLDDSELEALLAHELAHLLHSDALPRALAAWYATLVEALLRPLGWRLVSAVLHAVFLPLVVVGAFVSRSAEFAADVFALRVGRGDGLKRLLIHFEPNDPPTLLAALLASHPASVDRIRRLETIH
jgi:Zn-dependent protease with chaperone function